MRRDVTRNTTLRDLVAFRQQLLEGKAPVLLQCEILPSSVPAHDDDHFSLPDKLALENEIRHLKQDVAALRAHGA